MLRSVDTYDEHFAFGEAGASPASAPAAIAIDNGADGPSATIPDAHLLFTAQFARAGADLVLRGEDGKAFVVQDYFAADQRARLLSPDGAALSPEIVAALAGPLAPGQFAQAAATPVAQAVGRVALVSGDATIVRNGVAIAANAGDAILKGDVLQTVSGTIGVTFADGSTLNLTANTRLVVNEFVYDPRGSANSQLLDLVQGSLTFISGEIAHNGDMKIGTPVATMGIRGTVGGVTTANDGTVNFYVSQSATGAVIINQQGQIIANVVQDGPLIIVRPVGPLQVIAEEIQKSPAQLATELAALQQIVNIQSVGQQIIQQFFQQDPNNQTPNPNPQSTDKPLTQIQIFTNPNSAPPAGEGGTNDTPPPFNAATITTTTPNPDGTQTVHTETVTFVPNVAPILNFFNLTVAEGGIKVLSASDYNITDPDSSFFTFSVAGVTRGTFQVWSEGPAQNSGFSTFDFSEDEESGHWTDVTEFTSADIAANHVRFVHDGSDGAPGFSISVSDGIASGQAISATVAYTSVDDEGSAPVISNVTANASYTEDDDGVLLSPNLTITDPDSANLSGAMVKISGGYVDGDVLTADTDGTNIVANYDDEGTLWLSGLDTVEHYQQVLESVRFSSYSNDPTAGNSSTSRTIEWQVGSVFTPEPAVDAGGGQAVAVADVNQDGKLDIIVANTGYHTISVVLGNGDGTFGAREYFTTTGTLESEDSFGYYPIFVATGDVNGDGKLDIVTGNDSNSPISLLLGDGAGGFAAPAAIGNPTNHRSVQIVDVDGDGKLDVISTDAYSDEVSVLVGNGDGTFADEVRYAVGQNPYAVAAGDINGDSKLDLVTANIGDNSVSVLLSNGDGTFQDQSALDTGSGPFSLALGDVNGDGELDIVTANVNEYSVSVLIGAGGGTFEDRVEYGTGPGTYSVALGDFNGDGKLDIVTTNTYSSSVSVLLGYGDGTFQPYTAIDRTGYGPYAIATGDLDNDGRPDVVIANVWQDSLSVLLGNGGNLSAVEQSTIDVTATNDAPNHEMPESATSAGLTVLGGFTLEQYMVQPQGNLDWLQDYAAAHAPDFVANADVVDFSNYNESYSFPGSSLWPSQEVEDGQSDRFFARFTGNIFVDATGTYEFQVNADDGVFLLIDGEVVSQYWWDNSVELTTGVHTVDLFYFDYGGGAIVEFSARLENDGLFALVGSPSAVTSGADFAIGGLSMYDEDAGESAMQTILSVAHGTLTVIGIDGAVVTGSGTNRVTITGSQWEIDNTLREAGNVVYKSVPGFHGADELTMTTTDFGQSGLGGSQTTVSTMDIAVNAVPVLSLGGGHVEDQFNSQAYNLNTGNVHWVGDWTEMNDGANTATAGEIRVDNDPAVTGGNFRLVLTDLDTEEGSNDTVQRTADLSGLSHAVLTFDYRRAIPNGDAGDVVTVYASSNGTTFTAIGTIGATGNGSFVDADYQRVNFDISSYISANTTIRFSIGDAAETGDMIYVDNVRITPMLYVQNGDPLPISSLANRITDADDSQLLYANVKIANVHDGDVLSVIGNLPPGIAATAYNAVSGTLTLYGLASLADYQTALSKVAFSNSTDYPGNAQRDIEVTVNDGSANSNVATVKISVIDIDDAPVANNDNLDTGNAGLVGFTLNPDNGHWYKVNTSALSWADAQAAAIAAGGYLATITSAGENTFVDNLRIAAGGSDLWIGASDAATEGRWVWAGGPESGQQFWQGFDINNGGSSLGYANWNAGEPNGDSEDVAHMQGGGSWNDLGDGNQLGSVIEASLFTEDRTTIISAASLLANDLDEGALTINWVGGAQHGTVTLVDGDIRYTPNANFNGAESFTYTVVDAANHVSDPATVTFTVESVNDTPQFSILNAGVLYLSEVPGVTTLTGLAVGDVDSGAGDQISFTATAGHGTLSLENPGDDVVVGGSGATLTVQGTLADLGAAIGAGVTYSPDNSQPDTDMVTAIVDDGHGGVDTLNFVFNVTGNPQSGVVSLTGTTGKDVIFGTNYNDTLTGNTGADTFVFSPDFSNNVVTDFSGHGAGGQGDTIALSNFPFANVTQMLQYATITDIDPDGDHATLIDFGCGQSITLENVNPSDLVMADFVFLHTFNAA